MDQLETMPQAEMGAVHQPRTCSLFNNQGHTLVGASQPINSHSSVKAKQTSSLLCNKAIRKWRVCRHNKHSFFASDQGQGQEEASEALRIQHLRRSPLSGGPHDLGVSTPFKVCDQTPPWPHPSPDPVSDLGLYF